MEIGLVRRIDIDDEMQQSYLDYAMSVIVARALPDARDGLKPVHRRILYAMHSMGIRPDSAFKKSARIVGEVLGKFHPHGDMAVYDAMARMAQEFSSRHMLVEGQGNFGSIDGDPPAAMRYTEARLANLATEMLADIEKDTVDFTDNFDGSLTEPEVLPSAVPNMLVNGATGIAVGMSTSIPPHNLEEVCDALIFLLNNWSKIEKISVGELMDFIQGPDFPTGGIIVRSSKEGDELASAYGSGRGKIRLQARAHIEAMSRGRSRIIVTELPYQTNKSNLIEKIADLARAGKLEGLVDLRDESDRQGMRIVLEVSKAGNPEAILKTLYRRTPMQSTFSIIMLALVEGEPRMLSLKQSLKVFLEHRLEVVRRRSEYDLEKAQDREHVLAGLRVALKNLDEIIDLIRNAKDVDQARSRLRKRFDLTEIQANAILDMPLRRLASLEQKKIEREYKEVLATIKRLEGLLKSKTKQRKLIIEELEAIKEKYADRRRTQIAGLTRGKSAAVLTASDLASDKETWVVLNTDGKLSRTATARLPRFSGRGAPQVLFEASGKDTVYLFDIHGRMAAIPAHTIPTTDDPDKGLPAKSLAALPEAEEIVAGFALSSEQYGEGAPEGYLVTVTQQGMVKKTSLADFPGPTAKSMKGVIINKGDSLRFICLTGGKDDLILVSNAGMAIRFNESDVRPMGLEAAGVIGMKLEKNETIVGGGTAVPKKDVLLLTEDGQGKRTQMAKFPTQGRNGKGVLAWKSDEDSPLAGAVIGESDDKAVVRFTRKAPRSLRFSDAPRRVRTSPGKKLYEVSERDRIRSLTTAVMKPK
ncbi:MAG: DNA gyrase subunit A [Anaerolineales bacterium]|jgi:DNA gyrase subunit A